MARRQCALQALQLNTGDPFACDVESQSWPEPNTFFFQVHDFQDNVAGRGGRSIFPFGQIVASDAQAVAELLLRDTHFESHSPYPCGSFFIS